MPNVKDTTGRDWEVKLTVAGLERVQAETNFDLLNLLDDNLAGLARLYDDPALMAHVMHAMCRSQVESAGLSEEAFCECFGGEVLRLAADAVVEATADFYQNPKQAAILRAMKGKVAAGVNHHLRKLGELIDDVNEDEIKNAIDRELGVTAEPTAEATLG